MGIDTAESRAAAATAVLWEEARLFVNLAGPSVIIQIFLFLVWTENAMYIGQTQGSTALAAISLANLAGNLTAMSLIFGMLSAVDTLAPQAVGRGDSREVGLLMQRGAAAVTFLMPFVIGLWSNMESLLLMLGQPEEVARLAGLFLKVYVMCVPPLVAFEMIRKFLQVQNIIRPFIVITAFVAILGHPFYLWLCVTHWDLGIVGAAVASTLSFLTLLALSLLHMGYNQPVAPTPTWIFFFDGTYDKATWQGVDLARALRPKPMLEFIRLGLSGILSMTEWWYWEAATFFAGRLGSIPLAAHSVAYNFIPLAYMVPMGISIGTSTRLGTLLGEGRPDQAWAVAKFAVFGGMALVIALSLVLQHSARWVVPLFATDEEVQRLAYEIWPWFSVFTCFDGLMGIQRGILVGIGRQMSLGVVTIIVLWVIGLPVMLHVMFGLHAGLPGLWQVMLGTYATFDGVIVFGYIFADWNAISIEAQQNSSTNSNEHSPVRDVSSAKNVRKLKAKTSDPCLVDSMELDQ
eukprot:m.16053 g.16053  ORF g.16053 m.16053 type:complete len:518 (+) comp3348_c0_seq1:330-1883(+)